MKLSKFLAGSAALFYCAAPASAVVVYTEDFETDGNGSRYTTSFAEFNNGTSDHFGRTQNASIHVDDEVNGEYEGINNSWFYALEDADQNGGTLPGTWETTNAINITGFTEVSFSMLFAAGSSGSATPNYENDDFVSVFIDFDGAGTFATQLLGFATPLLAPSNQHIHQDITGPFDGLGEGVQVTDTLTTFTSASVSTGGATTAKIRITFDGGATSEEFAWDNLMLDAVPEPSSAVLVGLGCSLLFVRRRR